MTAPRPLSDDTIRDLRRRLDAAVARACPRWFSGQREDIVQNALVRLVRSLESGGRDRDFSTMYLVKAAHGAAVDEIRRWCRGRTVLALEDADLERRRSDRPDPERRSVGREIGRAIQDCLGRLVRPRQLVVTLVLQGCTVPETARRLHWSLPKTEKLVYRGLGQMRHCLRRKGVKP